LRDMRKPFAELMNVQRAQKALKGRVSESEIESSK
jgi:hypothetical protein